MGVNPSDLLELGRLLVYSSQLQRAKRFLFVNGLAVPKAISVFFTSTHKVLLILENVHATTGFGEA